MEKCFLEFYEKYDLVNFQSKSTIKEQLNRDSVVKRCNHYFYDRELNSSFKVKII